MKLIDWQVLKSKFKNKDMIRIFLVFISIFVINNLHAQEQPDSLKAATTLEELFTACNSSSPQGNSEEIIVFDRVAPYIVYNGSDELRNWKIACDYNKLDDRKIVDSFGKQIKNWLDEYESYKLIGHEHSKEGKLFWHELIVQFEKDKQTLKKSFHFIEVGNKYLLGKIK